MLTSALHTLVTSLFSGPLPIHPYCNAKADYGHHQLWAKAIFCCCFLGSTPATLFHFMMKPFVLGVFIIALLHFFLRKVFKINSTEIQYSTIFQQVTMMKSNRKVKEKKVKVDKRTALMKCVQAPESLWHLNGPSL